MSYSSKSELIKATKALKSKMNKKSNRKLSNQDSADIMKETKEWDYGQNPQKNCKLGANSVLQRLCSIYITSNIAIPKTCNLSFCTFAKGTHVCCPSLRWINDDYIFKTPYCQFNLVKSILNG